MDTSRRDQWLRQLYGQLEMFDADAEKTLSRLDEHVVGAACMEQVMRMRRQVVQYDFDDARETLLALAKVLNLALETDHGG
ncbi:MAG: hypothetical protein G8237_11665 [Magnetococcales bacterium]|nr:hypothetical protein [Magnetococcales bacterium]NGZ07002.1 hypothetical protein [Magnetococcales bacterium]